MRNPNEKVKIADHRNEGFTARDAMYEQTRETSKAINRSITTKIGLKDYTKAECEELAGPVLEYNYNKRYSWGEFKDMPVQNKEEYLRHLTHKYEGLLPIDICRMFEISRTGFDKVVKKLKVTFPRVGGRYMSDGRKNFYNEMFLPEDFVASEIPEDPTPEDIPEDIMLEAEEILEADIKAAEWKLDELVFTADIGDIPKILDSLNLAKKGIRVRVSIKEA